jgi:hypothetical protein
LFFQLTADSSTFFFPFRLVLRRKNRVLILIRESWRHPLFVCILHEIVGINLGTPKWRSRATTREIPDTKGMHPGVGFVFQTFAIYPGVIEISKVGKCHVSPPQKNRIVVMTLK